MKIVKTWWDSLGYRERVLISGSVVIALLLLGYVLAWEPFQSNRHRLQQSVAEQRADLAWMQQATQEIQRLSGLSAPKSDGRSLLTLVDQTARTAGLGTALKQITPQGDDKLSARLDRVEFDKLLPWLAALERQHPIMLINLSVDRTETAGLVNARIILQGTQLR